MGLQQPHILGRLLESFLAIETTPGTRVKPTAADAIRLLSASIGLERPKTPRDDAQSGDSEYEYTDEKLALPVTLAKYVIPATAAGAAPDEHELLREIFGQAVEDPGVKWSYKPKNGQTPKAFSYYGLYNATDRRAAQWAIGTIFGSFSLQVSGTAKPQYRFEGRAMRHVATGATLTTSAEAGGAAVVPVTAGEGEGFDVNSWLKIGANDNSGNGWDLSAAAANQLTLVQNTATWENGDIVRPFAPTPSLSAAKVIGHTVGSLTIDNVSWPIISANVNVLRNLEYFEDEWGADGLTDAVPGWFHVRGDITVRARRDHYLEVARRKKNANRDIVITMGSGRIVKFRAQYAELPLSPLQADGPGIGQIQLPFLGKASTEGAEDQCVLSYE
jgi:hypothetical protein